MVSLKNKDFITTTVLEREEIELVLKTAEKMESLQKKNLTSLKGKILASLFFEPSTRTQLSFATAMKNLGGEVIGFGDPSLSSIVKGESLKDTIKAVESYSDIIVLRHPNEGAVRYAAEQTEKSVINAGDGTNQHPSQAMLDLYTIKKEKGKIDGLTVLFIGDLKYGRTVKSLAYALTKFEDTTLQFYAPQSLRLPSYLINDFRTYCRIEELEALSLKGADVIYATRIQKERIVDPEEYEKSAYRIDSEKMKEAKEDAILLHPLPRVDEIALEVDYDKRAKYFQQEANAIPCRMALLQLILAG